MTRNTRRRTSSRPQKRKTDEARSRSRARSSTDKLSSRKNAATNRKITMPPRRGSLEEEVTKLTGKTYLLRWWERKKLAVRIFVGLLALGAAIVFYTKYGHMFTFRYLKTQKRNIDDFVEANPVGAPLAYTTLMTLIIGFNCPGATMLSFSGGLFFAQPTAMICAYLGYVVGAIANYGLIRLVFADSVRLWLTKKSDMFKKFEDGLNNADNFWETVGFLVFIRYVAFFPFWFVNASCAVLSVGFPYFALTTAVSTIPGSAIYTFSGRLLSDTLEQMNEENERQVLLDTLKRMLFEDRQAQLVVGLVCFCALMPILMKIYTRRKKAIKASKVS